MAKKIIFFTKKTKNLLELLPAFFFFQKFSFFIVYSTQLQKKLFKRASSFCYFLNFFHFSGFFTTRKFLFFPSSVYFFWEWTIEACKLLHLAWIYIVLTETRTLLKIKRAFRLSPRSVKVIYVRSKFKLKKGAGSL